MFIDAKEKKKRKWKSKVITQHWENGMRIRKRGWAREHAKFPGGCFKREMASFSMRFDQIHAKIQQETAVHLGL